MKKSVLLFALLSTGLLTACIFDSDDEKEWDATKVCPESKRGTFTDNRDGRVYKYTTIGNQVWMAENLNYEFETSFCYYKEDDCDAMGRIYSPKNLDVCPSGWHVSSWEEWKRLFDQMEIDGKDAAGVRLKSTNGWSVLNQEDNPNGTDDCNFSIIPAFSGNNASYEGYRSVYLTSTDDAEIGGLYGGPVYITFQSYKPFVYVANNSDRIEGYVRCVKD